MNGRTWIKKSFDEQLARSLAQELSLSPLLAELMAIRKIGPQEAANFLQPSLKNLIDPLSLIHMPEALERIAKAINNQEHIGIFGDYDVDGVCGSALLAEFLKTLGALVSTTLPHRLSEGYGLSKAGVDRLKQAGATLLITVDCGILAHEQISYANSQGFEVIVVDHHTVGDTLPDALAVVNPKRPDCSSQTSYLCAAGVCFFVCIGLRRLLREQGYFKHMPEPDLRSLLDLVALATVCDVVPLVGHNRNLVRAGLKIIKDNNRPGISALMKACGVDAQKISSQNLGFHLGPRINAAGRLEDAHVALSLLHEKNLDEAMRLSLVLDTTNAERKEVEKATVEEACALVDQQSELPLAIVLHREHWHPGVVGIVASRLAERYHRPSIIIGEKGKGSGRSIKGIDLHAMVLKASSSLAGFGGHAHAIGLSLGPLGVDAFNADLQKTLSALTNPTLYAKQIFYDTEITLAQASLSLVEELAMLEPFGAGNAYPIMCIRRCSMRNLRKLNGGHLKGELEDATGAAAFIAFRTTIGDDLAGALLDVLVVVEKNQWQGQTSAQLRLIDFKPS